VISMELLYFLRFTEHVAGNSDLSNQRSRFSSNRFFNQFCVHIWEWQIVSHLPFKMWNLTEHG
jgi:hypothetical protein